MSDLSRRARPVLWRAVMRLRRLSPGRCAVVARTGAALLLPAPGASAQALDGPAATLTSAQAGVLARQVIRTEYTIDTRRRYARACSRRSRLRMVCRVRWVDTLGTFWRGTVDLRRSGTFGAPVERFTLTARGDRNDAPRRTYRGTLPAPRRRTYLGRPLDLEGLDGARMRVTIFPPIDPLAFGQFDAPAAGTRWVGFAMSVTNIGAGTLREAPTGDAVLFTTAGAKLSPGFRLSKPCEDPGTLELAPGATGTGCLAFEIPVGAAPGRVELRPGLGFGPQLGQWYAR